MPNPRITIAVEHAANIGEALKERKVTVTDPVQAYDEGFYVGSFPDSDGNKL